MENLYDQDFCQQPDPINQIETDTPELVDQDLSVVNELETENSWHTTDTQWDSDWQNETNENAFNHQLDESWQNLYSSNQGFNYEQPEALVNDVSNQQMGFCGLDNVHLLADLQVGPTCGYETIENIVQCFNPHISNNLSDQLQIDYPGEGGALNPEDYQKILNSYDIPSHWANFDHEELVNALDDNRPIVLVGDAHDLDSFAYPEPQSWHAITLSSVCRDLDGNLLGYRGIDSNFPGEEKFWSCSQIEQANENFIGEVLITDKPADAWPFKTV